MSGNGAPDILTLPVREIVRLATSGRLRTGPYTRSEVWGREETLAFLDSLYQGFPTGLLIVAEGPSPAGRATFGGRTVDAPEMPDAWTVVDGYQRVSALVRAWHADDDSADLVCFDLAGGRFRTGPHLPLPRSPYLLPLPVAVDPQRLDAWLREHTYLPPARTAAATELAERLGGSSLFVQVIRRDTEVVFFDVFARINTGGRRLTPREVKRAHDMSLPERRREHPWSGQSRSMFFGALSEPLVRSCLLACGGMETTNDEAFRRAVRFLQEYAGIPHVRLIPDPATLPVVVRFFHRFGEPDQRARELLRRWLWRADASSAGHPLDGIAGTAVEEAQRLLSLHPAHLQPYRPNPLATRSQVPGSEDGTAAERSIGTESRLNALGLLDPSPGLVAPDAALAAEDVPGLFGTPLNDRRLLAAWLDSGAEVFTPVVPGYEEDQESRPRPLGACLLHPPVAQQELLAMVLEVIPDAPAPESHHLDAESIALLREQRYDEFTERRTGILTEVIARRVQTFARVGFRDRRTLPTLAPPAEDEDES